MAEGKRPETFRTRKLSPPAPMVLHPGGCGRVGRRRTNTSRGPPRKGRPSTRILPLLYRGPDLAEERRGILDRATGEEPHADAAVVGPAAHRHVTVVCCGLAAFQRAAEP